jgi:hypothetical protein
LLIKIGSTLCGTTKNTAMKMWTTYYCDPPVTGSSITIERANDAYFHLCGIKAFSSKGLETDCDDALQVFEIEWNFLYSVETLKFGMDDYWEGDFSFISTEFMK